MARMIHRQGSSRNGPRRENRKTAAVSRTPGTPARSWSVKRRSIRKTTGIRDLHPHMFRYSHATRLHELGVDDKSIQHWEGHASQDTTTKIYIKQTNDRTERAGKSSQISPWKPILAPILCPFRAKMKMQKMRFTKAQPNVQIPCAHKTKPLISHHEK